MKLFLKDFFSQCDQIRGFLWIQLHLLKKSQMENFIFCAGIIFHGFGTKMAPEAENGCTRIKMLSQLVLFTIAFPCRCFTVESPATIVPGLFFFFAQQFLHFKIFHHLDPRAVHSTSWKFGLYFVYIFIADRNFLTNFCSSDPSFNRNILTSLYLKSETYVHAWLCDNSFTHTIHKFHDMMSVGNLN